MLRSLWESKPIMAARVASELYGIGGMLFAIGGLAVVPTAVVGAVAFIGSASWPLVTLIGISGYALAFVGMLFLLARMPTVKQRVSDRELKQDYFQLSESLFRFADERDENAPPEVTPELSGGFLNAIVQAASDPKNQERTAYEDKTRERYSKEYGSRVGVLLDTAEQREWIKPEERQRLDQNIKAPLNWQGPTAYIREMAQYLERFGHKL